MLVEVIEEGVQSKFEHNRICRSALTITNRTAIIKASTVSGVVNALM